MGSGHPVALLIQLLWVIWLLYWLISARRVKRARQPEPIKTGLTYRLPLVAATFLVLVPDIGPPVLATPFMPRSTVVVYLAAGLVAVGLAFAIWARLHIAENWSGRITVKEDHELVRTGPYRWIRHPIYTGLLLALGATVVAIDTWQAAIAFVLFVISFVIKLFIEERVMTATFGEKYTEYSRETSRLVPGIW
jgi:protein-S-isoprenylcysteine O-methyltransferase Ste14